MSAIRALGSDSAETPLLLSFYCAGTPSQKATDELAGRLSGTALDRVTKLWYRGRGWPGDFTVTLDDDSTHTSSYDDSWGKALGPTVQWRCKICVDGVGESADVTAADFWRADARGYPDFSNGEGVSALIARTERGRDLVLRAIAAGVIEAVPMQIDALAAVQPLQRDRRKTLAGRLAAIRFAGGRVPRYRGFSLLAMALHQPRTTWRSAKGTYRRRKAKAQPDD